MMMDTNTDTTSQNFDSGLETELNDANNKFGLLDLLHIESYSGLENIKQQPDVINSFPKDILKGDMNRNERRLLEAIHNSRFDEIEELIKHGVKISDSRCVEL